MYLLFSRVLFFLAQHLLFKRILGGNGLCAWGESIDASVIIVDQLISYCGVAAVGSMCTVRIGECVCGGGAQSGVAL